MNSAWTKMDCWTLQNRGWSKRKQPWFCSDQRVASIRKAPDSESDQNGDRKHFKNGTFQSKIRQHLNIVEICIHPVAVGCKLHGPLCCRDTYAMKLGIE